MPIPEYDFLQELEEELHDLCQPLTALQFRLELGKYVGDTEALSEAVIGALEETSRMFWAVNRMREKLTSRQKNANPAHVGRDARKRSQKTAPGASN